VTLSAKGKYNRKLKKDKTSYEQRSSRLALIHLLLFPLGGGRGDVLEVSLVKVLWFFGNLADEIRISR
jgi:hypothetical protein